MDRSRPIFQTSYVKTYITMSRKAPEDYDCFIYKRDLRRFFVDLRKQAHYIYELLEGAPKSVFWIVQENEDSDADEQTFTV